MGIPAPTVDTPLSIRVIWESTLKSTLRGWNIPAIPVTEFLGLPFPWEIIREDFVKFWNNLWFNFPFSEPAASIVSIKGHVNRYRPDCFHFKNNTLNCCFSEQQMLIGCTGRSVNNMLDDNTIYVESSFGFVAQLWNKRKTPTDVKTFECLNFFFYIK